jgi:Flp pilus assembly pilin Flp
MIIGKRVSPMSIFRRFAQDNRGTSFESIALTAAIVAVACVAGADFLDRAGKSGALPHIAFIKRDTDLAQVARNLPKPGQPGQNVAQSQRGNVDYSSTASIPTQIQQRSVLDPCGNGNR